MKKLLALSLAIMLVLGVAGYVFADAVYTREPGTKVLTVTRSANAARALDGTVGTNNSILGFSYSDSAAGNGAIYDSATAAGASGTNLIGEILVAAGGTSTIMFPFPRAISNGLVVGCSTTTGVLIVYYE